MSLQEQALKELAIRKLEEQTKPQRDSLYSFLQYYREKEKKTTLDENRHIKEMCDRLEKVYSWEIKRLIINIPPRSMKTEIVSKAFPVWCLWHEPRTKFMLVSYSSELAQKNNWGARDIYNSNTYFSVFPRREELREDQNNKQHRETVSWWQMYASGSTWTLTWVWADCIIIDDALKPEDANSDVIRKGVNNNYTDTIKSRLNSKIDWAIVIIMQRLHDDDLCGFLLEQERLGIGEKREKLIIPAIAEKDDEFRKQWESFFPKRFPLHILNQLKTENPTTFSTQYQQNPVNKDTQEFHEEWFKYYAMDWLPSWRIFTSCDPAFSKKDTADNTCIMTALFDWMDMYVLEYSVGKYNPAELIDKLIYHNSKRKPEKIGIESFQAQQIIGFNLKAELDKRWQYANIEEIRQTTDKWTKIRKLIPLYRNGHIYHQVGMTELEFELKRFPRWRTDDIIDSMQMLYSMYELVPNNRAYRENFEIVYDDMWNPKIIGYDDDF
jgi:predicted phage terminase large subunit-like protein